jgi:phosphatidate phosphatase APP1
MPGSVIARLLHATIADLERDIDAIHDLLAEREGCDRKVRLLGYAGYRNSKAVRLRGRIVRYKKPLDAGEGLVTRLRAMMEIYNSHELPGISVRCEGFGHVHDAVTDEEGYYEFELPAHRPLPENTQWESVTVSTPDREAQQPSFKVPIIAPGTNNNWGVISDIDDTVVETGATDFLKNWRRVLVDGPKDRLHSIR